MSGKRKDRLKNSCYVKLYMLGLDRCNRQSRSKAMGGKRKVVDAKNDSNGNKSHVRLSLDAMAND